MCMGKKDIRPKFNREIEQSWAWKTWALLGNHGLGLIELVGYWR